VIYPALVEGQMQEMMAWGAGQHQEMNLSSAAEEVASSSHLAGGSYEHSLLQEKRTNI
jgi:hypothetical protein